jgi:xylulokinase
VDFGCFYAVTDVSSGTKKEATKTIRTAHYAEEKPRIGKLLNINGAGIQYRWLRNNMATKPK